MRSGAAVARDWARALQGAQRLLAPPGNTLGAVVAEAADPAAPALIGEAETLSYAGLAIRASQAARWARAQGWPPGEVLALLMPNRPDYIALWLGLTQAGYMVALLNTHLPAAAQAHCVRAAGARHVIVAGDLPVPDGVRAWRFGTDLDLSAFPGDPLTPAEQPACPGGRALLIFTSGTTGLPKAAHVGHARILEWSGWFAGMMAATADDRLFDCLPLYHSTGGVVAVGAMLAAGGAVILRERFSASRFWPDIARSGATIFQYIGELPRFLLAASPEGAATGHRLRLCCGNGLAGDVWEAFQARFAIPQILEFYAATEGSVSLYNCEGRPGAIGRVPPFLAHRFPLLLLRVDPDTGEPLRDAAGRCIPCGDNEPGEAAGLLQEGGGPAVRRFEGYTDPAASARKLLADVAVPGDRWFRTGDLLRRDPQGFYAFVDRLGDTFRWKGENVSTAEVAAVLRACPGVADAVAYGVPVSGADGRAGMAALVTAPGFDMAALHSHLRTALPAYARPRFLRLCSALDRTGTFKLVKTELVRQGTGGAGVWMDQGDMFLPHRVEGDA